MRLKGPGHQADSGLSFSLQTRGGLGVVLRMRLHHILHAVYRARKRHIHPVNEHHAQPINITTRA